jgi:hypothetical protein
MVDGTLNSMRPGRLDVERRRAWREAQRATRIIAPEAFPEASGHRFSYITVTFSVLDESKPWRRSTCPVLSSAGRTRGTKLHCCCRGQGRPSPSPGQASSRRLERPRELANPQRAGMMLRREWRGSVPGTRDEASLAEKQKQKRPRCDSSPQCLIDHSGRPLALGERPIDGLRTKPQGLDDSEHPPACCCC